MTDTPVTGERYARGGYIPGPPVPMQVRYCGKCTRGHDLYSLDGTTPEHVISPAEIRAHDMSSLDCHLPVLAAPVAPEVNIPSCCDRNRMRDLNTRHRLAADELEDA